MFPANWHKGQSCYDILAARAWYGEINPWFWLWIISTPILTFAAKPDAPKWQRTLIITFIIGVSYIAIYLGTYLNVDIRNAPFQTSEITSTSNEVERFKFDCYDTTDGPNYVFAFWFGWIPAVAYAGWWEIIWGLYHKKVTKLIDKDFKRDFVTTFVIFFSITILAIILSWLAYRFLTS